MTKILAINAREVLDSRGNPTVEAEVKTKDGCFRAIVPSGASTGTHEALELRDGGKRYGGKGVLHAVRHITTRIAPQLKGMNTEDQQAVDQQMINLDGTPTKSKLGANALLAVSMAACRAGAAAKNTPLYQHLADLSGRKGVTLPLPMMNVINGGKHAGLEEDPQEHMLTPKKARNFSEALQMCTESYHQLGKILHQKHGARATLVGDEGGFVPPITLLRERLDIMLKAAAEAGYEKNIGIALDPASSEYFNKGTYTLHGKKYSSGHMVDLWSDLVKTYPIISLEDGMAEDDWQGWQELTRKLGNKMQIVGDDLLVTNPERISKALKCNACNALLLKVNQIGTVTEAITAAQLMFKAGKNVVVSHRSGETEDSFIADLAVGLDAGQCKFGAPARSERTAKYNQLLRIEEELDKKMRIGKMI
ncbi:phosphopyruvate hydratase [Candidatus Woesearchaeota archaeon]|nr:phosphopyruvate hydratase [Candidatus Woesearchaeota archaeon]